MPTNIWVTSLALLLLMIPAYDAALTMTEIRQIMPEGGTDPKAHHIQVKASGATGLSSTDLNWELAGRKPDETFFLFESTTYQINIDEVTVTFSDPLPDFNNVILLARDDADNALAIWSAGLELRDLKARVAVVGSSDGANAFLRVTTGDFLDEVIVDSDTTCMSKDSPCYFLAKLPENIVRCVDLETAKAEPVRHCDDTFSKFEALTEQPALHLRDDTELTVSYSEIPDSVEVLLVDTTNGEQIPNSEGISCTLGDQECSLTISNRIDAVDIMVVMLDDKGYVVGSDTYLFENYNVSWLGLSSDVLIASWASSEKSDFLVKLLLDSAPDTPVSQSVLTCGGDGTADASGCEVFFAEVDLASINTITIEKQNDTNSVGRTGVSGGDTPPCSITKLTISDGNNGNNTITFEVTTGNGIPLSATIAEIINDPENEVGSSIKYTGQVIVLSPESYMVEVSLTTPVFGDKRFILIGHNETIDNGIQEMGTVYSTLIDFKGDVNRVGKADVGVSALWLTNTDGESFSIDSVPCESVDLCYLLDFPTTRDTVPVCTEITNGGGTLNQCVIKKPEVAEDMSLSKFQLKDRKNVVITAPFVSDKVHIILYNASHNRIVTNCSPTSPSRVDDKTCTSSAISLPDDKQSAPLKALLVGIDNAGVVKDATAVEVEDLQFTTKRFYDDTLTVEWTASNPEGYTATLQELALEAISLKANREEVPSNIECGGGSCAAFYRDLNPSANYALSVSRIGESISETSEVIEMNSITVESRPEMKIANVKKIGAQKTEINLAAETEVNIAFKFYVLVEMPGIQFLSPADIVSKTQISFNHDIPIFDGAKLTSFILLCYDIQGKLDKKGRAYLELQNLDSKLAWVASDNSKSLRVDAGSQEEVVIGIRKCLKKDSPCYFIDDKSLPDNVERCVQVQNTVDSTFVTQCDTEITSFKELTGVDVTLSGNNVEVFVTLEDPNDFLEVKIYDPANSSAIFSVGNASCDATFNGSSTTCLQPLRTPSDRRPVKVLVVEMDVKGVVLKSSVSDITFPATGVESWVIAVSVLASVLGVAVIVFVTVVVVKKQKSKKVVRKELEIISGDDHSRSITLDDIDDDRYSRIEQKPYRTKNPAPPVPMKPFRRDSVPPMGSYGNPYGPGYDNPAYGRGERFGDAPVGLPRIQPRIQGGPGRPGYY